MSRISLLCKLSRGRCFPGLKQNLSWFCHDWRLRVALQCYRGELPSLNKAHHYDAVFVTGSHYSANDDYPWVGALAAWLRMFVRQGSNTRLIGICFGSHVCYISPYPCV